MVRKIVLSLIAVLGVCAFAIAQNQQVSGTVSDANGSPVVGATVVVDGTTNATTTNSVGQFTISAPANGVLVATFLGFEPQSVPIGGRTNLSITLHESAESLDNVIVVAFGTAKREAFTGSATVIKAEDLIKTQSSNVQDALVGRVAGVQFSSNSGRPGSGQMLLVRGVGSLNAGNEPLWIVDGAPYEGDINNINTADIESISILKDAASNALYGARGANGVVMVTTKRAKVGEAYVTFDAKWGINTRALQHYDVTTEAGEFYEMHHRSLYNFFRYGGMSNSAAYNSANGLLTSNNAGGVGYNVFTVPAGQNLIGTNGRLNPLATEGRLVTDADGNQFFLKPDNWMDAIYKTASFRQEYNVSVAGATERASFYTSLGYLDNTGIIDGSHQERYTARLRADYQAKKWLKVGGNMAYTHFVWLDGNNPADEGAGDGGNAFNTAIRMAPIYPIYIRDGNGNIIIDRFGFKLYDSGDGRNGGALRSNGGQSNQLQDIQLNRYISEGNAFMASGFTDIDLYKGLKLTLNGSVMVDETRGTRMLNPFYGQFATSGGAVSKNHSRDISYNLQQLLNYRNSFGQHNIELLLGHEVSNLKNYRLAANRTVMFSPDNIELNGAVVDGANSSSSINEYINEGYFFRGQYNFEERIFLSGSYRREASSRFHPDHRWGNFWSAGAAWLINKENWFNATWVDMLKAKVSYGSQGNDKIADYLYVDRFAISNDGNDGVTTVFDRKGNPTITWETNANLNIGVEFAFWGNRLTGGIEFYNRKTTDMLFELATPIEAGFSSIWTNVGDMVNRGVEVELFATLMRTKDFEWNFSINATHGKNKVTRLPEQYKNNTSHDGKMVGRIRGINFLTEGKSRYAFYTPTYAGVDQETGKSLWYTYTKNAETGELERVTTDQYSVAFGNGREVQGDALPDVFGGFGTSLRFRGFDFSANFTYQLGGQIFDEGYSFYMNSPLGTSTGNNYHRDLKNAWSPENPNSNIPRFAYNDSNMAARSSRFLTSTSFLNIQNMTLGYTLPKHITRKILVENLRIYVACDNVWYWSKRQGLDPRQSLNTQDLQAAGVSNPFFYAPIRTFSGGIRVTF